MDSARRWGGDFKHQREETLTCGQELHPSPSHLLWFIWMRKWRPRKAKTFAQGHTAGIAGEAPDQSERVQPSPGVLRGDYPLMAPVQLAPLNPPLPH
ncbi:uncharacterized protein [Vicugna pacos]|uniref:Uncharacterized protein isoform X3 n=1 Tax=Vicugna pacos TaxID=30538 RepID=A0ABM5DCC3_VICPA